MSRVVHFEISADDPQRCVTFYERVFGWKIDKTTGPQDYWVATTGSADEAGINGGILRRFDPMQRLTNTIDVSDIDATIAKIRENGGKISRPKLSVPGLGWLIYVEDTEGNLVAIMQRDENAL